jgi:hypothetical protein
MPLEEFLAGKPAVLAVEGRHQRCTMGLVRALADTGLLLEGSSRGHPAGRSARRHF